jgi:hypothetical protein
MDEAITALSEHVPVACAIIVIVGMFLRWICREMQELRRSIERVGDHLLVLAEKIAEQQNVLK